MMTIVRFEEIVVWQKSKELSLKIYNIFEKSKDYSFRDQIQRAAVSVMNNIAEGYERKSNNEFKQFLYISKGSCGEVRSMLHLSKDLYKINEKEFEELNELTIEIAKMLSGFIKKL